MSNLIVTDKRATKTIELPSYEGSSIEIVGRLTIGDVYDANGSDLALCVKAIKTWNLVNEKKEPLPISEDSIRMFNQEAFYFLLDEIQSFAKSEKTKLGKDTGNSQE